MGLSPTDSGTADASTAIHASTRLRGARRCYFDVQMISLYMLGLEVHGKIWWSFVAPFDKVSGGPGDTSNEAGPSSPQDLEETNIIMKLFLLFV